MPTNLNLNLDYYYGTEEDRFNFYRVPKTLLTDSRYKSISIEAKVLYGLLLDRMGLSVKNGWMDKEHRVYIYFTQEDAMELMRLLEALALSFADNTDAKLETMIEALNSNYDISGGWLGFNRFLETNIRRTGE